MRHETFRQALPWPNHITLREITNVASCSSRLCHQLDNTASVGDLLLRQLAHPSRAHNQRDLGDAALAKDLGVAEGKEVEDGDGVLLLAGQVGLAGLAGDEGPELKLSVFHSHRISKLRSSFDGGLVRCSFAGEARVVPCRG